MNYVTDTFKQKEEIQNVNSHGIWLSVRFYNEPEEKDD